MILVIDNYDSFTYNLVHYIAELGGDPVVRRNDSLSVEEALALKPQALVISPGPCAPDQAGICLPLLHAAPVSLPILGVCLGHQAIGQAFGGRVIPARELVHGKVNAIRHEGRGIFSDIPDGFSATRYHSLAVERSSLPEVLQVTARTADGEIMGLEHTSRPIHGVQFHPESIATEHGRTLLANFLRLSGLHVQRVAPAA